MDMSSVDELIDSEVSESSPTERYSMQATPDGLMIMVQQNIDIPGDGIHGIVKLQDDLRFISSVGAGDHEIQDENPVKQSFPHEVNTSDFGSPGAVVHKSKLLSSSIEEGDEDMDVFYEAFAIKKTGMKETELESIPTESSGFRELGSLSSPTSPDTRPVKEKPWPLGKTKVLLGCMRKHQQKFRKKNNPRKSIWSEISMEMQEKGFNNCDRDECGKKWDNLFRTYKTVSQRDGKDATWELFHQVRDLVKLLSWSNPSAGPRRLQPELVDENDSENFFQMCELLEQNSLKRVSFFTAFKTRMDSLNRERDTIIDRIKSHMTISQSSANNGIADCLNEILKEDTDNETQTFQTEAEGVEASNPDLEMAFQINFGMDGNHNGAVNDELGSGSGLFILRLVPDKNAEKQPVYELIEVNGGGPSSDSS